LPTTPDPGDKSPTYKNQPPASTAPTHNPEAAKQAGKKSWIEIELVDEDGKPVPGEAYRITLPDGTTIDEGTLDDKGLQTRRWYRFRNLQGHVPQTG